MHPKQNVVDGITKPNDSVNNFLKEQNNYKDKKASPLSTVDPQSLLPKVNKFKTAKKNSNDRTLFTVIVTAVVMIVLVELAYLAYTKSK
jgi:O-succinylbenzoate synthase